MAGDGPQSDRKRRFIELPSPFVFEPGTVRLLEPAEGFGREHFAQLCAGTLGYPFMIDYGKTRSLFFTVDAVQSAMRLDDPDALVTPYTRKMMAFLLFTPAPRHVLMIGLGGGSLAKFCYRHLPDTRITVVEVNADIIALRDEFAIPPDDERFEIVHEDGAAFLARTRVTPDVILIDAFDAVGVSPSLAELDFYGQASRSLTPRGLLVMNLSGEKARYTAPIDTLRAAFHGSVRVVPVHGEDNMLLFAFKEARQAELPDTLSDRARSLQQGFGLEFSRFLERLRAGYVLGGR